MRRNCPGVTHEAIVAGRHPADLSAKTLTERIHLPISWDDQRSLLGFA
ncbi:MAG: hypothetical protein AB7D00_09880 [Rhodospirillaceae bacterium]